MLFLYSVGSIFNFKPYFLFVLYELSSDEETKSFSEYSCQIFLEWFYKKPAISPNIYPAILSYYNSPLNPSYAIAHLKCIYFFTHSWSNPENNKIAAPV
jgi:hypothetical protein